MAEKPGKKGIDQKYWLFALKIVGDFGVTIALPVVLFVLIGQKLDTKYAASPWFTVGAFVLAALVSGNSIYHKAKRYGKEYQDIDKK